MTVEGACNFTRHAVPEGCLGPGGACAFRGRLTDLRQATQAGVVTSKQDAWELRCWLPRTAEKAQPGHFTQRGQRDSTCRRPGAIPGAVGARPGQMGPVPQLRGKGTP